MTNMQVNNTNEGIMEEQTRTTKKRRKPLSKNLQVLNLSGDNPTIPPLLGKPIRINKVRDARRLLGKLILEFQKGDIVRKEYKSKNLKSGFWFCDLLPHNHYQ